ncbi:MAG: aminomethyl-transferring glycine dehydrogenase subunit GcvPA [Deltaproteobacteria bacterium]|nr:aminomethyl-transferring glycine dehydrogenase subunit GcvPA [Deltaproteobacteria bacterium]
MRYLPHTTQDISIMLHELGFEGIEDLFAGIPHSLMLQRDLHLPGPMSEPELNRHLENLEKANPAASCISFLGAGAYSHAVPAAVDAIVSRSEFSTAYTPYQPEVSQGTLQSIFEFQTVTAGLLGMDVANASMYDGASAAAEAVLMAKRVRRNITRIVLSAGLLPEVGRTIETYVSALDLEIIEAPLSGEGILDLGALSAALDKDTALVVQTPNFLGCIEDMRSLAGLAGEKNAFFISFTAEPYSLAVLEPPGSFGVDVATAEGQAFGNPVSFGGPYLGLFATSKKYVRRMPGRLVGLTRDGAGKQGFVLTLATREQHIRRARATSNICSNEGLCALASLVHLCCLGPEGLARAARISRANAEYLKAGIAEIPGFSIPYKASTFNEFVVETPVPANDLVQESTRHGILPGVPLNRLKNGNENRLLICTSELHTRQDLDNLIRVLKQRGA